MRDRNRKTRLPAAPTPGSDASQAVAARDYDAVVVNPNDATGIAITVLQPQLATGEAAPLILHGHGFGGALGLSYGGGFWLIGACVDTRFTAIVPTATWHDLNYSLAPDNVVKTAWGTALVALGTPTSGVDLDIFIYRALLEGLASPLTGFGLSNTVADRFYKQSPASFFEDKLARDGQHIDARQQRRAPEVDALLLQGLGGVPTVRITVTGDAPSPVAFIGLGIQHAGRRTTILVNKQIRPIRDTDARELELNGASERLLPGDKLGLLVYGYHPQYLASFFAVPGRLKVRGRIDLPIIDVAEHAGRGEQRQP